MLQASVAKRGTIRSLRKAGAKRDISAEISSELETIRFCVSLPAQRLPDKYCTTIVLWQREHRAEVIFIKWSDGGLLPSRANENGYQDCTFRKCIKL